MVRCVFLRSAAKARFCRVKAEFSFAEPWKRSAVIFRGKADAESTPAEQKKSFGVQINVSFSHKSPTKGTFSKMTIFFLSTFLLHPIN